MEARTRCNENDLPLPSRDPVTDVCLLEGAFGPRTTAQTPARWNDGDHSWKHDFMNLEQLSPEAIAKAKAEFERQKELANRNR